MDTWTARRCAISWYSFAAVPSGEATTLGRPESVSLRMSNCKGNAPSQGRWCSAARLRPPSWPNIGSLCPQFAQIYNEPFSTIPRTEQGRESGGEKVGQDG